MSQPTCRVPCVQSLTRQEVLLHIAKFPEGLTFGQIQRFIVEWHGLDYDEFERFTNWNGRKVTQRKHRGWWCDNLLGDGAGPYRTRIGILHKYCDKNGKLYTLKPYAKIYSE